MKLQLEDEAQTRALAERLQRELPEEIGGWTMLLSGELGAGKSTFARALIRSLGHDGPVPSPTYTLVEPYQLSRGTVYHVDLYRVSEESELRFLGWNELDDGFRLVEWPERVPGLQSQADVQLTLAYAGGGRSAALTGLSDKGRELVRRLRAD